MKHFVSVVFNQKDINETQIVESMLSSANMALMESHTVYGLFESENENLVLKLRLDRELTESESDAFADRLANKLFDQGYDDFDIEVSVEGVEIYEQTRPLNLNDYKRQIEAAGPYTVSANGMNVTDSAGASVAGVNQNGNLWSGSQVITNIVNRGQTDSRQPTGPGTTTSAPQSARQPSGSLSAFAQAGQGGIANNPEETEAIRELQDKLREAGFDPGATDGRYGPRTANAVRQFQQANNLSVDGDAGPETIQALLAADPEAPAEPEAEPEAPAEPTVEPEAEPDAPAEPVQGAPEPRSSASIAADPDNTGNAADPEAQTFVQDTPAATRQIRIATRGPGTDEESIFRVMSSIQSSQQWSQLQREFEEQYGMNLIDHLESELNPRDMTRYVWDPLGRAGIQRPGEETGADTDVEEPVDEPTTDTDAEADNEPASEAVTGADTFRGVNIPWSINDLGDSINLEFNGRTVSVSKQQADTDPLIGTDQSGTEVSIGQEFLPELHAALSNMISPANESINYDNPILEAFESSEETYDGDDFYEAYGDLWFNEDDELDEAEYQGRKVKLGKPMRGDVKKFKVYVKNPKGNVVKVNFGDPDMKIKKSNPARRRSFRARHNCDNPGPRHKARFWSCKKW